MNVIECLYDSPPHEWKQELYESFQGQACTSLGGGTTDPCQVTAHERVRRMQIDWVSADVSLANQVGLSMRTDMPL